MRKGTGVDFIGTSTRFYAGRDMGTPATDLYFLRSRARLRPPGGELSNYEISKLMNHRIFDQSNQEIKNCGIVGL